jgi:hypothetical protein
MGYATENAARLDEIEFPAFTTKLISDTFDMLIASNIKQIDAYKDLLKLSSMTLSDYINQTNDDFGPTAIMEYLGTINLSKGSALDLLPSVPANSSTSTPAFNADGVPAITPLTIPTGDIDTLNNSLILPIIAPATTATMIITKPTTGDGSIPINALVLAVAKRLASNKYDLLQAMVKMGMMRLVVEKGTIESKLTFSTYESEFKTTTDSKFSTSTVGAGISAGYSKKTITGAMNNIFKIAGSVNYSKVKVNTSTSAQTSSTGTNINIMGRVELQFKTDYQPLSL